MRKINLLLCIRSLDIGGAERQFIELVKHINKSKFDVTVCSMYGGVQEDVVKKIEGIRYINLAKKGRFDIYFFSKKYKKLIKDTQPDIIYSFMGEANIFSFFLRSRDTKIVWGFRASDMDLKNYGFVSRILFYIQKIFSKKVDLIISNSKASINYHKSMGFDMSRAVVIYNGIDTDRFIPKKEYKREFYNRYMIPKDYIIIGLVARVDPMKGYIIFAKSVKKLLEKYSNIIFIAVGSGDSNIKSECEKIIGNKILNRKFFWLSPVKDVEIIYNGIDILVSSSIYGEGFSNSIAEAMSCGVPCVVTDVGDSAIIVGDTGIVVKKADVDALEKGIEDMINRDFKSLGARARDRILENFTIENMVKKTEAEILKCVGL